MLHADVGNDESDGGEQRDPPANAQVLDDAPLTVASLAYAEGADREAAMLAFSDADREAAVMDDPNAGQVPGADAEVQDNLLAAAFADNNAPGVSAGFQNEVAMGSASGPDYNPAPASEAAADPVSKAVPVNDEDSTNSSSEEFLAGSGYGFNTGAGYPEPCGEELETELLAPSIEPENQPKYDARPVFSYQTQPEQYGPFENQAYYYAQPSHGGGVVDDFERAMAVVEQPPMRMPSPPPEEPADTAPEAVYHMLQLGFNLKRFQEGAAPLDVNVGSEYADNEASLQSELFELGQAGTSGMHAAGNELPSAVDDITSNVATTSRMSAVGLSFGETSLPDMVSSALASIEPIESDTDMKLMASAALATVLPEEEMTSYAAEATEIPIVASVMGPAADMDTGSAAASHALEFARVTGVDPANVLSDEKSQGTSDEASSTLGQIDESSTDLQIVVPEIPATEIIMASHEMSPVTEGPEPVGQVAAAHTEAGSLALVDAKAAPSASGDPKVEPSTSSYPKLEPSTSGDAKAGPSTSDNAKAGLSTSANAKAGPSTSDNAKAGPSTSNNAKAGPSTSDNAKAGPSTSDNAKAGPSTSDNANAGPSTSDNAKAGPSTSDNANAGPSTSDNAKAGPSTSDNAKAGPSTPDNAEAGLSTSANAKAGPSTPDNAEAGLSTSANAKAGPSTSDNAKPGQSTSDNAKAGPSSSDIAKAGPSTSDNAEAGPSTSANAKAGPSTSDNAKAGPSASKNATGRSSVPCEAKAGPPKPEINWDEELPPYEEDRLCFPVRPRARALSLQGPSVRPVRERPNLPRPTYSVQESFTVRMDKMLTYLADSVGAPQAYAPLTAEEIGIIVPDSDDSDDEPLQRLVDAQRARARAEAGPSSPMNQPPEEQSRSPAQEQHEAVDQPEAAENREQLAENVAEEGPANVQEDQVTAASTESGATIDEALRNAVQFFDRIDSVQVNSEAEAGGEVTPAPAATAAATAAAAADENAGDDVGNVAATGAEASVNVDGEAATADQPSGSNMRKRKAEDNAAIEAAEDDAVEAGNAAGAGAAANAGRGAEDADKTDEDVAGAAGGADAAEVAGGDAANAGQSSKSKQRKRKRAAAAKESNEAKKRAPKAAKAAEPAKPAKKTRKAAEIPTTTRVLRSQKTSTPSDF